MNDIKGVSGFYNVITEWLIEIKKHQLIEMIEFVEQAKLVCTAAEAIPEQKIKQFIAKFSYDLHEFYVLNQQQASHSIYLGLLNEYFWRLSVNITDKTQVEWAELAQDFHHHGDYQQGDTIGFGILLCKKCKSTQLISHLSTVESCIHCGHEHFYRQSLSP